MNNTMYCNKTVSRNFQGGGGLKTKGSRPLYTKNVGSLHNFFQETQF